MGGEATKVTEATRNVFLEAAHWVPSAIIGRSRRLGLHTDAGHRFDIVFLDPPYESPLYEPLLEELARGRLLDEEGLVAVEHFHKRAVPERMGRLTRTRSVRVGDHRLSFYRFRGEEAAP